MGSHGTARSYRKGCRCGACTTAYVALQREGEERRKDRLAKTPDTAAHGLDAYRHLGCRCPVCRDAHTAKARAEQAARSERKFSEVPHGTVGGYRNWSCRCPQAVADALKANPGVWARVAEFDRQGAAASMASKIGRGRDAFGPRGAFEATSRTIRSGHVGSQVVYVYARYVGLPDTP